MARLPSFISTTPPGPPPEPLERALLPPRGINAAPNQALLVENDESLLKSFREWLENEGYAVRTALNTVEGLRLFRDCAPFNVVLINYYVPQNNGDKIGPLDFARSVGWKIGDRLVYDKNENH